MSKRKEATEYILKWVGEIDPKDTHNVTVLRSFLESMSDREFDSYMKSLLPHSEEEATRQEIIPYFAANLTGAPGINVENNFRIAEEIGHKFYQRIWIEDPETGQELLTPHEHLKIDMPCRRQAQLLIKKSSIPQDGKTIDDLSGQVTGDSKGSKLSFPELQANASQKLDSAILEKIKIRGGDEVAYREFERIMIAHGSVSQEEVMNLGSKVKSTKTVANLLRGMLLGNNLDR